MKLHLTISLRAALLCALCSSAVYAEETSEVSNKIITIDLIEGWTAMPSDNSLIQTLTPDSDGVYTLSGTDRLGAFTDNGEKLTLGKYEYKDDNGNVTQVVKNVTKNVKVDGTLLISDNAQVYLGGQYEYTKITDGWISTKTEKLAEYTGIIADKIIVKGNGTPGVVNLQSYNLTAKSLTVESGVVKLHNDVQSGNNHFVVEQPKDSKQVRITENLTVNGGEVTINLNQLDKYNDPDDTHTFTGFGNLTYETNNWGIVTDADISGATINQDGGTLTIEGKTASVGGLNIEQTGGNMYVATNAAKGNVSWHILSDYGDSTIKQENADSVLYVGGIKAYNSQYLKIVAALEKAGETIESAGAKKGLNLQASIKIEQENGGKIELLNGVDFRNQYSKAASTDISTISQSGTGGSIVLNGAYQGATFNIEQTGTGKIELASGATMTANQVTVDGTMNVAGSLNLVEFTNTEGETSAAGLTVSGTLNVTGSLTLKDATITLVIDDLSQIVQEATTFAAATESNALIQVEEGATFDAKDAKFELLFTESAVAQLQQYDLDALKLELISGVNANAFAGKQITLKTDGDVSAEDLFGETSYSFSDVTGSSSGVSLDVQSTAAVPEPTTATLSLLALAGLCARRRRR